MATVNPLADDTIEVTGTGSVGGPPDLVLLDVRVQAAADSVAGALTGVERATSSLLETARASDALRGSRTQSIGVHQRHDQQGRPTTGYTAYAQVRLEVLGAERVGELIPLLAQTVGDALTVDNLALTVADPGPMLRAARDAAFADARSRAEQFAALAGRSLGAVLAVRDAPEPGPLGPGLLRMARADDAAMPIEGGQHLVAASVTVRWSLGLPVAACSVIAASVS